jgi:putative DNA primase/helicase
MDSQNELPVEVVEDDDVQGYGTLSGKALAKEKLFQKMLAIIGDWIIITCNLAGMRHATTSDNGIFDTTTLQSSRLANKVKRVIRERMGIRVSKQMVAELIEELHEEADNKTLEVLEVHHRVASGQNGQIFVDLRNDAHTVIEVDKSGYRHYDFASEIPLFYRTPGMMPLPDPVGIVPNLGLLRDFLNLRSDGDWRLLIVFIVYSLRPFGPYVILVVAGIAGSSKSTFSRLVRMLIDPSSVSTQALPKSIADLMITAKNSHLLVFDNVRKLSVELSDAFCRIATGGGYRTRTLYTDDEETLIHVTKPCILNGIDDVASQPDLVSRCILMDLPTITTRRTEEELNSKFAASHPAIFAGLMDTLSKTLAELENVTEAPTARMADFARFGMAVERALSWPKGSFNAAFEQNQQEQMTNSLGDDPLAAAMRALVRTDMEVGRPYIRTPTFLLQALTDFVPHAKVSSNAWPQTPHSLSKRLKKMEPALRACGIGIAFHHSGNRTISVTRLDSFTK